MPRPKLLSPESEAAVCRDYEAGMSRPALAERYGVSVGSIGVILRRNKIKNHQRELNREERESLCGEYASGATAKSLAAKYQIQERTVYDTLRKFGVTCRLVMPQRVELNESQIQEIISRYQAGEPVSSLRKRFGAAPSAIKRRLLAAGVECRGYKQAARIRGGYRLNHAAFDVLTDTSAYWIGMLMTDGCINDKTPCAKYISLPLNAKDIDHVLAFREFMGSNHKVVSKVVGTRMDGTLIEKACLTFASDHVADVLAGYGVIPRKSHVAKAVGLEKNRHFWRGMIDGDGSVAIYPKGVPHISLTCNSLIAEQFHEYVHALLPFVKTNPIKDKRTSGLRRYSLGCRGAWHLINELYGDCEIALPRKWAVARKILETPYDKPMRRDWSDLTWERLLELKGSDKTWTRVVRELEIDKNQLTAIRKRAKLKALAEGRDVGDRPSAPKQLELFL